MYTYTCVCIDHILFIHSSISGHSGCFHLLAIVNSAAKNMGVQIFSSAFNSFGNILRSGLAGPYGNSRLKFLGITILFSIAVHPHQRQQRTRAPIIPQPHDNL